MRLKYSKSRSTGFDSSGLQRGARSGSALFSRMSLAGGQRLLREIDYDALSLHGSTLLCELGASVLVTLRVPLTAQNPGGNGLQRSMELRS